MKYLLDTQAVIWSLEDDSRLSEQARNAIDHEDNEITITIVSLWEIAIKRGIGKLDFTPTLDDIVTQTEASGFNFLNLTVEHLKTLEGLAYVDNHRDPFDRLIISQAQTENLIAITSDPQFESYPINTLW